MEQAELDFSKSTAELDAEIAADLLQIRLGELQQILQAAGDWVSSKELIAAGFTERELRLLVQNDREGVVFSFPGSKGYKSFDFVTDQEFDQCGALKAQGEKMIARYARYRTRWHRRFKPSAA